MLIEPAAYIDFHVVDLLNDFLGNYVRQNQYRGLGFLFLGLSTMAQLEIQSQLSIRVQSLSVRWAIFISFISIESLLLQIMYIIPFGSILVFIIKAFVILPENKLSKYLFEKIRKLASKIINKQSSIGSVIKQASVFVSVFMLIIANHLIQATGTQNNKTIQNHLKTCSKLFNKKEQEVIEQQKAEQEQQQEEKVSTKSSKRSKIQKLQQPQDLFINIPKIKVHELIVKDKKFIIARPLQIIYNKESRVISFVNESQQVQVSRKLIQIKYISQDLMRLQLVLNDEHSYPIQLMEEWQINDWMKPVIKSLRK